MIVETAFYYSHENDIWEKDPNHYSDLYPISAEGQRRFTEELVTMLNKHDDVTGLFWWFPEENESGSTVVKAGLTAACSTTTQERHFRQWTNFLNS